MIVVVELLFALMPLACWLALARTPVVGTLVGLLLTGCAVLVTGVHEDWFTTRAKAEVYVGLAPAALLLIAAGALAERGLRGPRAKRVYSGRSGGAWVALVAYLVFFGLLGTPVYLMFTHDSFVPSTDEVLPLPSGLTLLSKDDNGVCGSGTCSSGVEVGSPSGLSGDEIAGRLRTTLTNDRGWHLDRDNSGCRPNGWLLDRRRLCLSLTVHDRSVDVLLAGADTYHG